MNIPLDVIKNTKRLPIDFIKLLLDHSNYQDSVDKFIEENIITEKKDDFVNNINEDVLEDKIESLETNNVKEEDNSYSEAYATNNSSRHENLLEESFSDNNQSELTSISDCKNSKSTSIQSIKKIN
ncbi:hypothetical protein HERIO_2657 [Hepatospora eriocheir]|uniref:Uncharacterized protein n=1 Tax=Hepatospora eriocheir TaxID=1081669 RepID=A0A1X0Q5E1_9MICR|nr:hypothetical protein HERIO_2657 [Hepatospora eriocheir]